MRTSALVLAILLWSTPAAAFFTSAEYTSVTAFLTISTKLSDAWLQLDALIDESNADNNSYINTIWQNMATAEQRWVRAVAYLFDVPPDDPCVVCSPRTALVAEAVTETASLRTALVAARDGFDTGSTDMTQTAGFRSNASTGKTRLNEAIAQIDSVWNPNLTYTDPTGPWYPRVLGPHGTHDDAVLSMVKALDAARLGMDDLRQAWNWVANSETIYSPTEFLAWGRIPFRMQATMGKMRRMLLRYNLVHNDTTTVSPARVVATTYEHLLSNHSESQSRTHSIAGLPYHFDQMAVDSFSTLVEAMTTRPVAMAKFITGWHQAGLKAWKFSDGSGWDSFKFPDDATLQTLRAAKNQANDPHGPPISYYFSP